ncbi:MAG TPA: sensor histidine kinase [Candidatus Limnocylindrales bacterium]|nr:sensor histidine kinase [Candidatus Limnocylindrales bacterium]
MITGPVIDRLRRVDQTRLDVALAVVLTAVTLLPVWLVPASAGGAEPDILTNVLLLATTLPIAFRRRQPVLVLAIVVLATTLAALTGRSSGVGLGVLIAVYSVAVHADRRRSLPALTLTMIAVALVLTIVLASTPGVPPAIYPFGLVLAWMIFGAVWLLGDLVRSRGEAVAELRQRNEELEAEREENARLAVADERARIGRELHDAVAHSLSVMVVQAGAARRALETAEPGGGIAEERARGALATIEATGRDTLGEMRRVVGALRPTGDEPYEPQPSLDELDRLLTTVREAGLAVELVVEGEARAVPRSVDLSAYRVVQESLTNTLKHAHAASARVRLHYGSDALDVEVTDDGRGAAARLLEPPHRGYGLAGMRERVAMVGGEIVAQPGPSGGFVVRARLPLGRSL